MVTNPTVPFWGDDGGRSDIPFVDRMCGRHPVFVAKPMLGDPRALDLSYVEPAAQLSGELNLRLSSPEVILPYSP